MCQQTLGILGASENKRKTLALTSAATAESLIVASNSDEECKYDCPRVGTTSDGPRLVNRACYKKNGRKRWHARLSSGMGAWEGGGTASKGGAGRQAGGGGMASTVGRCGIGHQTRAGVALWRSRRSVVIHPTFGHSSIA